MAAVPSDDVATLRAALAWAEAGAARTRRSTPIWRPASPFWSCRTRRCGGRCSAAAERGRLLVDQLELGFEELETTAREDEALATKVAAGTGIEAFTRARPPRRPLPAHLPRLRDGEPAARTISRHVARPVRSALARAGAVEMFGQHQPRNRQAERYAREGVDIRLSTLADQIGACAAALAPLHRLIAGHVLGADDVRDRQQVTSCIGGRALVFCPEVGRLVRVCLCKSASRTDP
ncbi:MAG: Transposase of ISAli10, family [Sphingomonas bacterium]|nr:Transposase of ISAli10, family [Sphingomonas bacterium]